MFTSTSIDSSGRDTVEEILKVMRRLLQDNDCDAPLPPVFDRRIGQWIVSRPQTHPDSPMVEAIDRIYEAQCKALGVFSGKYTEIVDEYRARQRKSASHARQAADEARLELLEGVNIWRSKMLGHESRNQSKSVGGGSDATSGTSTSQTTGSQTVPTTGSPTTTGSAGTETRQQQRSPNLRRSPRHMMENDFEIEDVEEAKKLLEVGPRIMAAAQRLLDEDKAERDFREDVDSQSNESEGARQRRGGRTAQPQNVS